MALPLTVRRAFEKALDPRDVMTDPVQRRAYECDGLTGFRVVPALVLLPRDAAAGGRGRAGLRASTGAVRRPRGRHRACPAVRCPSRTAW